MVRVKVDAVKFLDRLLDNAGYSAVLDDNGLLNVTATCYKDKLQYEFDALLNKVITKGKLED